MPIPDLAVVVVNHNAGAFLERCMTSVFASVAGIELEVVIVDNGSTDGSAHVAATAHPDARLIEQDNRGFAAGVNTGIRATTAPFVFVLNPDAEVFEGTLAAFVKFATERPRAGAIGPLVRNSDGTIYSSGRSVPSIGTAVGHAFLGPFLPNNRFTRDYRHGGLGPHVEREVDWIAGCRDAIAPRVRSTRSGCSTSVSSSTRRRSTCSSGCARPAGRSCFHARARGRARAAASRPAARAGCT